MNVADMMGALGRRWYVLVAGLVIAGLAAFGAWTLVKVEYVRTATQLMLPGSGTMPEDANPFLYVGGLSQAADVLVRKMGSPDVLAAVQDDYPDMEIVITRDPYSSGPVLLISVTSSNDADAADAVEDLLRLTEETLLDVQRTENITAADRITLVTLTTDDKGAVEQKSRLIAAGAAGAGTVALTLLAIALIDGLARSRAQRRGRSTSAAERRSASGTTEDAEFDDNTLDADALDGEDELHGDAVSDTAALDEDVDATADTDVGADEDAEGAELESNTKKGRPRRAPAGSRS